MRYIKVRKLFSSLLLITILPFAFPSCVKKDSQPPEIILTEPFENEAVADTTEINIEGIVTDNQSLHELTILILNSTGDTAYESNPDVHALKSYSINQHYSTPPVDSYRVEISAIDHEKLRTERVIHVTSHP